MDKNFLEELLDGIRGALGKPLPCNGEDKLCKQMECCFYKNTLPKVLFGIIWEFFPKRGGGVIPIAATTRTLFLRTTLLLLLGLTRRMKKRRVVV